MEGVEQHLAGRKSGATVAPEKATDALRYKELTQPNMFMWPWEKKKSVFWGLVKMAILDWGNDLESENNDIKAMTSSYLTEIGVLAVRATPLKLFARLAAETTEPSCCFAAGACLHRAGRLPSTARDGWQLRGHPG
jgi:hypothetical protein